MVAIDTKSIDICQKLNFHRFDCLTMIIIYESKHYVINQYHPKNYSIYPIAGRYSGWQ